MQNLPKLRFRDFKYSDFRLGTIGDFGFFYYGKSAPKTSVTPDGATPCVRYGELYSTYGPIIQTIKSKTNIPPKELKLSKGGEVLVPRVGENPMDFAMCSYLPFEGVAIGEMISVYNTTEDGKYISQYFNGKMKKHFARVVEGGNVSNLYFRYLEPIDIALPSLEEQQKVVSFLTAVDTKIEQLTQKEALLKQYKKGVMQKIFSQEIRFKADDGSEFPEWEESTVGEHFDVGSSKRVLQQDWVREGVPFYRTRELVSLARSEPFSSEIFITTEMYEQLAKKYGVPSAGDYLVSGVGTLGIYYQVHDGDKFYFKDGNVLWLKRRPTINSDFFRYCFESEFVQSQIVAQASTTTVGTYTIQNARKTRLVLPRSLEEQEKISAVLGAMDRKIRGVAKQLEVAKTFKKGLLQQMFV